MYAIEHRVLNEVQIISDLINADCVVLDVGCGDGKIARVLKEKGCAVVGIEVDPAKAHAASHYARVFVGDAEDPATIDQIRQLGIRFDCILCSHVLEHLKNPLRVLRNLTELCNPEGGFFVIALPNVAYWKVRLHLCMGRWEYQDEGILDRTHLRFFTFHSALDLLRESGLQIVRVIIP